MIDKRSFEFLFADTRDIFFTRHSLQLDFEQYLYYYLKREHGEPCDMVFYVEENKKDDRLVKICCEDDDSAKLYYNEMRKFRYLGKPDFTNEVFRERKRKELLHKKDLLAKVIANLLIEKDKRIGLVLMGDFYQTFINDGGSVAKVLNDSVASGHNVVIVDTLHSDPVLPEAATRTRWEPCSKEQIRRMVRRVNLKQAWSAENMDNICSYLTDYFSNPDNVNGKLFEERVGTNEALFTKILLSEDKVRRLEQVCFIDNR